MDIFGIEVEVGVGIFLMYYIEMRLQNDCGLVFYVGCCGFFDDDVVWFIDQGGQFQVFVEGVYEGNDLVFFFGRVGYSVQGFEIFLDGFGFKVQGGNLIYGIFCYCCFVFMI